METQDHSKSILFIIDDDEYILEAFRFLFKNDFKIYLFSNGYQSLKCLDITIPDLILTDVMMPEIDGFQLCKLFKEDPRTKEIPVIFISALDSSLNIKKCFQIGAVDYISKPVQYEEIKARVNLHLSINALQQELRLKNQELKFERDSLEQRVIDKTNALREKDVKLLQMDRLVSTYTLAAGIAHEINTPLGVIKSALNGLEKGIQTLIDCTQFWNGNVLSEDMKQSYSQFMDHCQLENLVQSIPKRIDRMRRSIERITTIVSYFRSFTRFETDSIAKININQSIEEALGILLMDHHCNITIDKKFSDIPLIECLSNDINQCILQLLRNAIESIKETGTITITTNFDQQNNQISMIIKDTGVGMSPETLKQAFHPFFTTKDIGEGTGVGLSISEKAIKSHGGSIHIDSQKSIGTCVTVRIPILFNPLISKPL